MNVHTKIVAATAILAQLRPGQEYPDGNINARELYTDEEIDELAASLLPDNEGQLRPMLVATHPKKAGLYFVFGGGRRRLAFERNITTGKLPKEHQIEIVDHGHISVAEALSKSRADNKAVPMHPADDAVTFARLAADRAPEDIARERGMTLLAVQRLVSLGQDLIPDAIKEWRLGRLTREAVQVLVLATSQQQKDFLKEVAEDGPDAVSATRLRQLREEISSNKTAVMTRLLGFVGVAAAKEAGLKVTQDFFGEGGVVEDLRALEKLATRKMAGLAKAEEAAGWSWSDAKITEARGLHHGYGEQRAKPDYSAAEKKRLVEIETRHKFLMNQAWDTEDTEREIHALEQEKDDIETAGKARAFTEKQKKAGGVFIRLRADGTLDYRRGVTRATEEKKAAKKAAVAPREREPEPLDWHARRFLQTTQNEIMGRLLAKHPNDVMALLLTAASVRGSEAIVSTNLHDEDEKFSFKGFEAGYQLFRKMTPEKMGVALCDMFPHCVAIADYQGRPKKGGQLLIGIVGEKEYQTAISAAFHAEAKKYFDGASHKHMLGIMAEAFGSAARKHAEDKSEGQLRSIFQKEIAATGWLPPELRFGKAYTGPTAKNPAKPADKKAR